MSSGLSVDPPWPFKTMRAYLINKHRTEKAYAKLRKSHERWMTAFNKQKGK